VPSFTPAQASIPFARVNHNKYLVTDKDGYIGTSNWSADYFISTGGIGFVFRGGNLRQELKDVFDRDWDSSYSHPLKEVNFKEKRGKGEQENWQWQYKREL
jgi:phospholipase D3/4